MVSQRIAAKVDALADDSPRTEILEAANQCFIQLGIGRTSVQDVARIAGVSRGTVYRYFEDRNVLIEAAIEFGLEGHYRTAAAAMKKVPTLAEQIGVLGEVIAKNNLQHRTHSRLMADDSELMRHMVDGSYAAYQRSCEFLLPYVEAAQESGEIRRDIDPTAACEWLARAVNSLFLVQHSLSFDLSKPKSVRRYVQTFAVRGLQ